VCLLLAAPQVAQRTASSAKLQAQVDSLSSSKGELLERMSALTGKWRSTVAGSQELHRQNIAAHEQVAALQLQLAQLQHQLRQQQGQGHAQAGAAAGAAV
jgi:chromosome segregation ATPase